MNKKNPCWVVALVFAGVAGCADGAELYEPSELASTPDIEALIGARRAEADRINARPCGDRTIAVITDDRNNQYVFCALGEGRVGVLESTWDAGADTPLTDRISDPVELLQTVVQGADLTPEIVHAVRTGTPVKAPLVAGALRVDVPRSGAVAACNFDTFANLYCGSAESSYWDQFASEFVHNYSSVYPDLDCTRGNRFCEKVAGWHQRTASANQAYLESGSGAPWGGACAAKERVISCGGSTVFQAWRRESVNSGSWVPTLENYTIPENGTATWIMYGDGSASCAAGADRDDMRYRAESQAGAYHNYSLFFIKSVENSVSCEPQ
jgi:hypothetical protein